MYFMDTVLSTAFECILWTQLGTAFECILWTQFQKISRTWLTIRICDLTGLLNYNKIKREIKKPRKLQREAGEIKGILKCANTNY